MKSSAIFLLLYLAFYSSSQVQAQSTSHAPPPRTSPVVIAPPDSETIRQGGDTMEDAFLIPGLPFQTTGTNIGYSTNCCWHMCPYEAWGPAVFYKYTPCEDLHVKVDLCGSDFDTGLYILRPDFSTVACNIDFYYDEECGQYVSMVAEVGLEAGQTYFIVVTGMSGDSGNYVLEMTEDWLLQECVLDISGAVNEGEPSIVEQYEDSHNGGCNSPEFGSPMQALQGDEAGHLRFAGVGGWYFFGNYFAAYRDTDWFTVVFGASGVIDIALQPEVDTTLYELAPQECGAVGIVQTTIVDSCHEGTMQITGEPGSIAWLWVGSAMHTSPYYHPGNEYDYILILDGLQQGAVPTEKRTWDSIRALYR